MRLPTALLGAVWTVGVVRLFLSADAALAQDKWRHPVYIGAKQCAECHDTRHMGNQFSRWFHTKHAKAYTSLAKPEARQIAKWSGIPVEPQESPMCLGCHATGAEAEPWEKDPEFSVRDGIQCEKCHGPGSEYAEATVMTNREAAMRAGLNIPTKDDCMNCHFEKGSHRIVLGPRSFDLEKAWQEIAHPTPDDWQLGKLVPPPAPSHGDLKAKYTGAAACAECHGGAAMGYQFSKWRASRHAYAYASLGTPRARQIAAQAGLDSDPRSAPECLKCHATAFHQPSGGVLETYTVHEGVGCEACHGAGSEYSSESVMKNPALAASAGLKKTGPETCAACHANAHGKPFDYASAMESIAHPTVAPRVEIEPQYKTPLNLAVRPDGKELYVACHGSDSVVVVDALSRQKTAEIAVGRHPIDVAFSPDGRRAYVSNWLDDSVSVIDVAARKAMATIPVGDEPHGVLTDRSGKLLYVLNTSSDDISVIDTATLVEVKRLAASRSPWAMALAPDGSRMYVTNAYSRFVQHRTPSVSEVTVLDAAEGRVDDRVVVPAANLLQGVAMHPSGRFALVTLLRTKNLVPMTRVQQGWTVTNGLGVIWANGRVDQVLLDLPGLFFPDPAAVAITPDGRLAFVTSSTSDRVAVVDVSKLIAMLEGASPHDREHVIPNHLGKSAEFVVGHVATKHSPRGVQVAPDGKTAYVANALDDSLTAIDVAQLKDVQRIDLGGPREITKVRYGERLFHNAAITFRRQFSCHTCHPDGHIDMITYDIEEDGPGGGIGKDPVDNRTLRGILDTPPFKWSGKNPNFSRQCGARLSTFFTRLQPFTPEQLAALDLYICTIPRPPNRHRPLGAPLTEAQRRGKMMFERTMTNDGRMIPKESRCTTCHFPPLYTDRRLHDVGTQMPEDSHSKFDTPHLNNIYDSAPYLHNGMAHTLEEIWTRYNPEDKHGVTNDMTKDQLNDLIEYLKTL